jgi:hypothetical protein
MMEEQIWMTRMKDLTYCDVVVEYHTCGTRIGVLNTTKVALKKICTGY